MIKSIFGTLDNGQEVYAYTVENNQLKMTVTNFGAHLVNLWIPDKTGALQDVVLGYDNLQAYIEQPAFLGATVGRSANRIEHASFEINGQTYRLTPNEGENNLHSGPDCYHLRVWDAKEIENGIAFTLNSPDGDQGYPGNLMIQVSYVLEGDQLIIRYTGKSDQTTVFNPTNHSYFNLNGHQSGSIEKHVLSINASTYTPVVNKKSIPTGEITSVEDTPMNFLLPKEIGEEIDDSFDQLIFAAGYDHNYILDSETFASVTGDQSGITMTASTNLPGVQFYSGNFIEKLPGKDGVEYNRRSGFCLETQFYPNAMNESSFPSPVLEKDTTANYWTVYSFKAE